MNKKLIFVRHGQSTANENKVYGGYSQCTLTSLGKKQAEETSKLLKSFDITHIISSDLKRAFDTATIINNKLNLVAKIEENTLLREVDCGEFTGTASQKGKSVFHMADLSEKGESKEDVLNRANKCINYLKSINNIGDILVVGHNSFTSAIFSILGGEEDLLKFRGNWSMKNASIKVLEI